MDMTGRELARHKRERQAELIFLLEEILKTLSTVEDRIQRDRHAFRDPTIQQLLLHVIPDMGLALNNLAAEVADINTVLGVIANSKVFRDSDPTNESKPAQCQQPRKYPWSLR